MAINREELARLLGGTSRAKKAKTKKRNVNVTAAPQVQVTAPQVNLAPDTSAAKTADALASFAEGGVDILDARDKKQKAENYDQGKLDFQMGAVDRLRLTQDKEYRTGVEELEVVNEWRDAKFDIERRMHEAFPDLANADPQQVDAWLNQQYRQFDGVTPEQAALLAPELELFREEVSQTLFDEALAADHANTLSQIQQNFNGEMGEAADPAQFLDAFLGVHEDLKEVPWLTGAEINEKLFDFVHARGIQDGVDYWTLFPQSYADGTPSIINGTPEMIQQIVSSRQQIAGIAAGRAAEIDDANKEAARLTGMAAVLSGSLGTEAGMRSAYTHIMKLSQNPSVNPSDITTLMNYVQGQLKFGEERSVDFDYSTQVRLLAHMGIVPVFEEDGVTPVLGEDGQPVLRDMTYLDVLNMSSDPRMGQGKANRNETSTVAEILEQTLQKTSREVAGHVGQLRRQITRRYTKVDQMGMPTDYGTPSAGIALAALEELNDRLTPEMKRGDVDALYREIISKYDTEADAAGVSTTGQHARNAQANIEKREIAAELEQARRDLEELQAEMRASGEAGYYYQQVSQQVN
jgi:hypothetical protein